MIRDIIPIIKKIFCMLFISYCLFLKRKNVANEPTASANHNIKYHSSKPYSQKSESKRLKPFAFAERNHKSENIIPEISDIF
tara:strand:+ start:405 stop:650 length:246 start_codon:yes stop_codon:yes gene_type:complete